MAEAGPAGSVTALVRTYLDSATPASYPLSVAAGSSPPGYPASPARQKIHPGSRLCVKVGRGRLAVALIQGVKRSCRWLGATLILILVLAGCGELFGVAPDADGGDGSAAPAASASALAASAPPSSASPVSATCQMGYVNIPAGSGRGRQREEIPAQRAPAGYRGRLRPERL